MTALVLAAMACSSPSAPAVRLATTTSVDNSGLLEHIGARFLAETGLRLETFVVGSGKALDLATDGMVPVTITHHPAGEKRLRESGHVARQREFMENRFLLVGPPENPAGVDPSATVVVAMARIHRESARFVSRGDDSGTHMRELELWRMAGVSPAVNPGYESLGQGMSALLRSASELQAYTLTDAATFARMRRAVRLRRIADSGAGLRNVYTISLLTGQSGNVDPAALRFYEWVASDSGRRAIEDFSIDGAVAFTYVAAAEPLEPPPIVVP